MARLSLDIFYRDHGARNGLGELGDEADRTADRFASMKKGMAAGAAAAGVAAGSLLTKGFVDNLNIEAGQAKLAAQLGLTQEKSKEVGKTAGALYAQNYGESLEDVNESIGSVIKNIDGMRDASAETMQDITKKVINLQNTTGETSGAITAAISQMLRNGLAKNADEAFDILTVGFQQGVNKSEDLLDTFNEYGTQFRKLGIDGKLATGLLSQGLKAGARDADTVADTLKEFSIRSVDMSKTSVAAFDALGLSAKDMSAKFIKGGPESTAALQLTIDKLKAFKDPVQQSQLAVALFGTKAEDMGQALYALDTTTAVKGLGEVAGAAERMDKTLGETGQARIETMKRGFEQWTQRMAGTEGALGDVSGAVVGFGAPALAMGGQLGMMAAGLGAMNVGLVASKIGTGLATAATATWSAVTKAASLTGRIFSVVLRGVGIAVRFALGPIGLIITAVALAAAGLIYAYRHSEKFRLIVDTTFKAVGKAAGFMWNNVIKPVFRFLIKTWMEVAGGIVHGAAIAFGWVPGLGGKLKGAARQFDNFKERVNRSLDGINDEKVNITASLKNNIPRTLYGVRVGGGQGSRQGGITMAEGGAVRSAWGSYTSDSVPANLSYGEHVWTAREVMGAGGHAAVEGMRKSVLNRASGGAIDVAPGLGTAFGHGANAIGLVAARAVQATLTKAMGWSAGLMGALNFAKAQSGKPYIWGGVGPRGYDCSGFMSAITNVAQGKNPYSRRFATGSFPTSDFAAGPGAFMIGYFRGAPGHMAGTLNGVNVESSGSVGAHYGSGARGARSSMFGGRVYHLKGFANGGRVGDPPFDFLNPSGSEFLGDDIRKSLLFDGGGILHSGGRAVNRSGRPERVLSARQTGSFEQLVRVLDRRRSVDSGWNSGADGIDYDQLGTSLVRAMRNIRIEMDGKVVGNIIGASANKLSRGH